MISPDLRNALVNSVSCGDEKLSCLIAENFVAIDAIAQNETLQCRDDIYVINLQLQLTEFAMGATRNFIDLAVNYHTSAGKREKHAKGWRNSDSWTKSQATSFFKARGDSFTNYTRTGEAHDKAFSTARGQSNNRSRAHRADVGRRRSLTDHRGYSRFKSEGIMDSEGSSCFYNHRESKNESKTQPNVPEVAPDNSQSQPTDFPAIPIGGVMLDPGDLGSIDVANVFEGAIPAPVVAVCLQDVSIANPAANICNLAPSSGESWKQHTSTTETWSSSYSFSIPIVGLSSNVTLSGGWSTDIVNGGAQRFQGVCTDGSGMVAGASNSRSFGADFAADGQEHRRIGFGRSIQNNDVKEVATNERHTAHSLHAAARGQMRTCDESHSGNRRRSHGEAQGSGGATSNTLAHKESHVSFRDRQKGESSTKYWNQVFKQLRELYDTLWLQKRELTKVDSASLPPASRTRCLNVGQTWLRNLPGKGIGQYASYRCS